MQRAAIAGSALNFFGRNITLATRSTAIDKSDFLGLNKGLNLSSVHCNSTARPKAFSTSGQPKMAETTNTLRYVDIGINLSDPVFRGEYHGKQAHEDDLDDVIQRAKDVGCSKFMVTGSDLVESKHAISVASKYPGFCYATVGVHPCQAKLFDEYPEGAQKMLQELWTLAVQAKKDGHVVAFGEIGLDYDRLFLSPKEPQLKYFEAQLDLAVEIQLPLFLHSRAASEDFERLLAPRMTRLPKRGLVHSFTGTLEEMHRVVALGLDVGVNGCSLKTEENLEVVKAIPLERLQIETDGPWCEIRPSHASAKHLEGAPDLPKAVKKEKWQKGCMVKGRNEPIAIARVAHVIASVKGITVEEVCEAAWNNSIRMFGLGEKSA
ncbi:hypothetical protein N7499_012665 [Penicillium canescens]|uniref:Uncharacterized protein n=1 Tax=Penicillium canescens TaxID=5083 RepID=A0AAD6I418_PENCN|nr:uncharacterized protein N7446_000692 [Penicillium canescens]KAJ6012731.1 hypothetical protein N7522_003086 [Penicillium canescens]KAJ6030247.1 hypothetical protein N7460_010513 [Penicillium canescens]KAJ6060622.1 hypothetical protein N7444_002476 [Penicillium canescens]KAJ6063985.1 hypothetical protein N7499_012665 [Penicillium canescens]KAJ6077756.1 hypothetical protein N7446_000692 [Penicillium canescens]